MAVSPTQQAVLSTLAVAAAALYAIVAWTQARRPVSGPARPAKYSFVVWWAGLAFVSAFGVILELGPDLSAYGLNGVRVILYALFALIFVMFAGLVHYLLYLYTGRQRALYWAGAFYGLLFLFLVWLIEAHAPHVSVIHAGEPDAGETGFHLHDEPSTLASAIFSLSFMAPPLLSALAYFLLFFRTEDRTARYRILLVSAGFVMWFGFSLAGSVADLATAEGAGQGFVRQLTGQLLGVLAAVLVLLAFYPPRGIQRRFGIRSVDETTGVSDRPLTDRPPRIASL